MKKLLLFLIALVFYGFAIAQTRSIQVEYQKISRSAMENEMPFSSKTVEKAIEDMFSKMGYKGSGIKGFDLYKGVRISDWGTDTYDIYFKTERKSRRDKENTVVTMMISKGFDAFVSDTSDMEVFRKAKLYLDSLLFVVAAYDLEQEIAVQEDELKSAEKKSTNLQDDGKDLEKKKRKLEDDITDNIRDQQNQSNEVIKQRQILENLKAKRVK